MSLSFFVAATPYQVTQIWRSIALQMEEQRRSLLLVPWVGRQQLSSEYFGVTSLNLKTMVGSLREMSFNLQILHLRRAMLTQSSSAAHHKSSRSWKNASSRASTPPYVMSIPISLKVSTASPREYLVEVEGCLHAGNFQKRRTYSCTVLLRRFRSS